MGRIKRSATDKRQVALSPYIADFVSQTADTPLHQLPAQLDSFPKIWHFPRGDLYHWIPVLNRFDEILERFVAEYGLADAPQTKPFSDILLKAGEEKSGKPTEEELQRLGFSSEGDCELVQHILDFSLVLLDHNSNRSLYSSNEHLNSVLNTTSLPLLKADLQLCLALAQRFYSSKPRVTVNNFGTLLQSHYNINLDKLQVVSEAFAKDLKPFTHYDALAGRRSSAKDSSSLLNCHPLDVNTLLKSKSLPDAVKKSLGDIKVTYYDNTDSHNNPAPLGGVHASPASPTPVRRTPGSHHVHEPITPDKRDRSDQHENATGPHTLHITGGDIVGSTPEAIIRDNKDKIPADKQYDLLHQVRIANGLYGSKKDLQDLVSVRMYALANLCYVYQDGDFIRKIGQQDNEQPRDFQLATQLADLLQPVSEGQDPVPLELQIAAVTALEALSKVKNKIVDVASALNISVSHGILFYVLQKVLVSLQSDELDVENFRWCEAVFILVAAIANPASNGYIRYTEQMIAAGLVSNIVQALSLRSANAAPHYANILHFFDIFHQHDVRDAFQALINAHGLDIIADLMAHETKTALEAVNNGEGLPEKYKTPATDYKIPFYKQQTLRRIVKFIGTLFGHDSGNSARHLRNFIDSPPILDSLKTIIGNATIFGSNVWINAVNIITNFIHNEPTSYNVILEAGLISGILDAISPPGAETASAANILPVSETLRDIPTVFGAICLNEAGMKLFLESQAIDAFLRIFTTQEHVKAMVDDDCAITIGSAFDELVRHHPDLKDKISAAVTTMVMSLSHMCHAQATKRYLGAKLWLPAPEGSGSAENNKCVAGGKGAMSGLNLGHLLPKDVQNSDAELVPLLEDEVQAKEGNDQKGSTEDQTKFVADLITVSSRFLYGYLHNSSMMSSFADAGGLAILMDLATNSCLPWNFHDTTAYEELAKVFMQVAENKVHLVLPLLVLRTIEALDHLQPLLDNKPANRFLGPWASFARPSADDDHKFLHSGTTILQALIAVQTLVRLISDVFLANQPMYTQRTVAPNYFTMIFLGDYYTTLVEKLARLQSACIWEEIHLQSSVPKGLPALWNDAETTAEQTSQQAGEPSSHASADLFAVQSSPNEHRAAFENREVFRYVLSQLPTGISELFHQLGKVICPKPRASMDPYHRAQAGMLAEQMATSFAIQLSGPDNLLPQYPQQTMRYQMAVLSFIVKIMVDKNAFHSTQPAVLILLLHHLQRQGVIVAMNGLLEQWIKTMQNKDLANKGPDVENLPQSGTTMILGFFARITHMKTLVDSPQHVMLDQIASEEGEVRPTDGSQLLVDLRYSVIKEVTKIWEDSYDGGSESIAQVLSRDAIHSMLSIMRSILEAQGEHRPLSTSEKESPLAPPRTFWRVRNTAHLDTLLQTGASEELALEALYRCNEHINNAREYCRLRRAGTHGVSDRLPIPENTITTQPPASQLDLSISALVGAVERVRSIDMQDAPEIPQSAENVDSSMTEDNLATAMSSSELPSHSRNETDQAWPLQPIFGDKADLDAVRELLRRDIVDRSLAFLDEHPDLSFDIADLIKSATYHCDAPTAKQLRADFCETLMNTLVSLRPSEDEALPQNKIAAVAHLIALILQEQSTFDASLESLKSNFDEFVQFLKVTPPSTSEDEPNYMVNILLVLERILVEDEKPHAIERVDFSQLRTELEPITLPPPLIEPSLKEKLFEAILELLPRVGKSDSFGLSITRMLVILTRRRSIAKRLAEKQNLGRLFLMVKQLAAPANDKLQAALMVVLRHLVEDDNMIRQAMETEIQLAFDNNRSGRSFDAGAYIRSLYHLVVRDPEIFLQVTGEKVKFLRPETSQVRSPPVGLKKDEAPQTENTEASQPTESSKKTDVTATPARQPLERMKTSEMKPPVVETSDGVIHFLMKELSSYRDVEDKEPASLQRSQTADQSTTTDVEMLETATPPPEVVPPVPQSMHQSSNERALFKTEEHVIFTYRCHLLQCLVELLSSYNHTKIEFINFSAKTDSLATTPSKPRSGFLHYLLTSLIPVGTLAHVDDISHRKKLATSNWAMGVVVALCTKTQERAVRIGNNDTYEDEPDLVYVRKFVLEQALKAFNTAMHSTHEAPDKRYSRLLTLSDLFYRMLSTKTSGVNHNFVVDLVIASAKQLGRLMYEKNFVSALTASIAEIDLNFPNAKRAVKYILRPLQKLTEVAVELSLSSTSSVPGTTDEDEISSATSMSEDEDDDNSTPDIFRNSTLGQFEAGGDDDYDSDEDEEGVDDYYGDEYDEEEMDDYEEDRPEHGEIVSDDDEEIEGMGPIEGMSGDVGMDVEIVMSGDSDSNSDSDDSSDDDDEEDDEDDEDHDDDDEMEIIDELTDHGHDSEGDVDEEDGWEDEDDNEAILNNVFSTTMGLRAGDIAARMPAGYSPAEQYFDDEMPPEDDDEDEEDVEDFEEDNIVYEPEMEYDEEGEEEDETEEGWAFSGDPDAIFRRHFHTRVPPDPWGGRMPAFENFPTFRAHRSHHASRGGDDGLNPLLRRDDSTTSASQRVFHDMVLSEGGARSGRPPPGFLAAIGEANIPVAEFFSSLGMPASRISIMAEGGDGMRVPYIIGGNHNRRGIALPFTVRGMGSDNGPMRASWRIERPATRDPAQAVAFMPSLTAARWQDEAKILFGTLAIEAAARVLNSLIRVLNPPAIEAKLQRDKADAEKKAAEDRAREERERKEAEERRLAEERAHQERLEREAREAEEAALRASEAPVEPETTTEASMENVQQPSAPAAPTERIIAMVRGAEVDITDLGIDPAFLAEIPEDFREDVIMQQLQSRVTQQPAITASSNQIPDEIDRDFLNILPGHIQQELLRQEASERNRREREQRRSRGGAHAHVAVAEEMNPADFMAMLDPGLRRTVLMDTDEATLNALPEALRAEAAALLGSSALNSTLRRLDNILPADSGRAQQQPQQHPEERPKRPVVQILDKAGVATLLRLIFFALTGSTREAMLSILGNICKNTQTRAEVISILLTILQDGSVDGTALDKSFTQLTMRAKQMTGPKTPQPLRRTLTGGTIPMSSTDVSPLTIVQQCLDALTSLAHDNPRVAAFFLTEHETVIGQRTKTPKKGKVKEQKSSRYPVNALLSLLDRRTIMENATAIEKLASTLVRVTEPLKALMKKANEEESKTAEEPAGAEVTMGEDGAAEVNAEGDKPKEKKKAKDLHAPEIPEENLCLVVNIIAARECSGKTFRSTLDIINHLSAIPTTRDVFGRELVRRAQDLGVEVLEDLRQLPQHIQSAQTSTEMQGLALGAFSPAGSHQNKLLRILLALDYIFDPKRVDASNVEGSLQKAKESLVSTLYENDVFLQLWTVLSNCLSAIKERPAMANVATILQPLVEAFMVVCKNTTPRELPVASPQETGSTPPPQNRIESLFFTFTEEHRKILNDLVRQNPKLMSGTFDVLVKNSKVLEFDNKRNFFNKRLHQRAPETRPQTLQLGVRRSQVFLDSFKALFFKKADEIKYGKLNIRFADEEGVDAGGVTREWFAALSRQMFDPNYALFNPVAADRTTFHPNPLSEVNEQHLTFFKFIGRIIGKALYEGRVLDCHFSRAVYKRILGKSVSLKDMETLDLDYYKSLVWILENDITDVAFETFSVEVDRFGEVQVVDLVPDGHNIPVTEDNKHEYVRLVVEQRLTKSVEEQLEHFLMGFRDIVPLELISIFNEQELELLISGLPDIDVDDWKNNTEYHNYTATSPQVQWFWRAVRSFDKEEKAKLLQFVTGTSKVPLNGFKELEGMNGVNKFNIHRDFGRKDRLPTSHTCFNQLDLPEYESYEQLRKQMYTAMTVGSDYFGFA